MLNAAPTFRWISSTASVWICWLRLTETEFTVTTLPSIITLYVEESGCNYFVGSFQWGDVTHEEASRSLNLFTSEVMPDFV